MADRRDVTTPPPKSPAPGSVPRSSSLPRIANSKLFLPLQNEGSAISTRGQHLPSLFNQRRPSTVRSSERGRRGSISEDDEDLESGRKGLLMDYDADAERRHSVGASILNTPQMRSQRLIGNSNPRYKW